MVLYCLCLFLIINLVFEYKIIHNNFIFEFFLFLEYCNIITILQILLIILTLFIVVVILNLFYNNYHFKHNYYKIKFSIYLILFITLLYIIFNILYIFIFDFNIGNQLFIIT